MDITHIFHCSLFTFIFLFSHSAIPSYASESQPSKNAPTEYMIITTGGELLRGIYEDKHVAFITRTLEPLGCRCLGTLSVGDVRQDILDVLQYASRKVNLIITTGGLGPTDADVTRKSLSEFAGIELQENPDVKKAMMQRFNATKWEEVRENLRRQTLTPIQGTYLPNPNGTAVGLIFDNTKQVIIALPGPPRELQPMVQEQLIPYLSKRFGSHSIGRSLTMRFVGIGESNIDYVIHQNLTLPPDLIIASQFELGRVDLTFSFPGNTPEDDRRLKSLESRLIDHIGEYLYADDGSTLEDCIIHLLSQKKATLISAEVGSGGSIAASLSHAKDATQVYTGGYVAPSDRILWKMVDLPASKSNTESLIQQQITEQTAQYLCEKTGTQWSLVVSEETQAADGSKFVWMALGSIEIGFELKQIAIRGHGETVHANLLNSALDLLRRKLQK